MLRSAATDAPAPLRALGVLLALAFALHVAGYGLVTLVVDSARDIGEAWRIAHGESLPLRGPSIGQRWSLGPAWFYLLAPIAGLAPSITWVALAVGVLAALKLPLAYLTGRRLVDARCGFLAAFLVALPGWASLEHVVLAHTNLAGTAMLVFALAALAAWRAPAAWRCGVAGFAFALALHAHPAALVAAPLALAPAFAPPRGGRAVPARAAALAAGFVLPFVPMLVAEAREGWPALARSAEYVAGADYGARLLRMPAVLAGTWLGGVALVRDFLLPDVAALRLAWVLGMAVFVGLLIGLCGTARADRARALVPLGLIAVATALLALLREAIAFYFVLPLLPLGALALAHALALAWPRRLGIVALAAGTFALAANATVLAHRAAQVRDGEQSLPRASLADVATWPAPDPVPVDYLPVAWLDATLLPSLCRGGSLHGDLATQLELAQGLPLAYRCDASAFPVLGGAATPTRAGLPAALLRRAGLADGGARGIVLLDAVVPVHPARGQPLALHAAYPPRAFALAADRRVLLEPRAGAGAVLAVTTLDPAFTATAAPRVSANGAALAPLAASASTRLYRCGACTGEVAWRVEVDTGRPEWVDVFVFDAGALASPR